jgi:uncharacterized membrane protein YgcG
MNSRILLLGLASAALTSCATAYKTGQTPDDVYYSPVKAEEEYVRVEKENDRYRNDDYVSLDDRRLRMQIRNRNRYCACNDDWYWDNWNSSSSWRYGWNNPWTWNTGLNNGWYYSYNSWCYSPYPVGTAVYTPSKTFNYKPPIRNFGNSNTVTAYNPKTGSFAGNSNPVKSSARVYNNSNRNKGSGFGGFLRQILQPSGNSNSSSSGSGNNSRTYNPSSSNSSGGSRSSGTSSGSSGSSRPARNGRGG